MARYDRLRGDGMGPAEAMRETAPLFAHAPRAYDRPYVPRAVLVAGSGESLAWTATPAPDPGEQSGVTIAAAQELRGRQIVAALQDRARAQRRDPLGEAEQRTVLETITNLSPDIIDRVVSPARAIRDTGTAANDSATARPGPAARPWEHDFPVPIQGVVASSAPPTPGHPPAVSPRTPRRSRSGRHRR
jgi:hypothetical protein